MNFLDDRLPAKFWAKLSPCPMSGCWLWTGCTNRKGYGSHGRAAPHSSSKLTHRYTYETARGALPIGTELDHRTCKTRSCANPWHLEAVAHRVNVQRGAVKKTRCKRGHELAGDNLAKVRAGTRCRACVTLASQERHRARYVKRARKPMPRSSVCKKGHVKFDNGKRMVCRECASRASRRARQIAKQACRDEAAEGRA